MVLVSDAPAKHAQHARVLQAGSCVKASNHQVARLHGSCTYAFVQSMSNLSTQIVCARKTWACPTPCVAGTVMPGNNSRLDYPRLIVQVGCQHQQVPLQALAGGPLQYIRGHHSTQDQKQY